jgi:hypothetical protein
LARAGDFRGDVWLNYARHDFADHTSYFAANPLLGWWWMDPVVGMGVAIVVVQAGVSTLRGRRCEETGIQLDRAKNLRCSGAANDH